uniref:Inositol-1-monophosphatase n=1 Tax=Ditylenchus dipsaci TaxID=166011 RepID=A0A915CYA2_9BILA
MAEEKYLKVALELVNQAGKLVRHAFTQPSSSITFKSSATDFVTATDKAVEELLIGGLSAQFPNHKFIGEESTSSEKRLEFTDQPTWIIDPIDGTTNFVHRIPLIAISVGLAINRKLQAGIIYNPITHELYTAQTGRGAFKNGFPIYASKVEAINKAVVSTSCNCVGIPVADKHIDWLEKGLSNLKKTTLAGAHGHSSLGSAAVIMGRVAEGCLDAYVEYGLRCWDMAAGVVIVREAGGFVTSPLGDEFNILGRNVLCSGTEKLGKELSGMLTHTHFELE